MTVPLKLLAMKRLAAAATMEGPNKLFDRETNDSAGLGKDANRMVDSLVIETGVGSLPGLTGGSGNNRERKEVRPGAGFSCNFKAMRN